jgi:hypothetical protein
MGKECFECGAPATEDHHVIPQSLGGTKTVPLCGCCHERVHDAGWKRRDNHAELTREGLRKAKERGVVLGNNTNLDVASMRGRDAQVAKANKFALEIYAIILPLLEQGFLLRQVAEYLNENNIASAQGKKWGISSVSNLVIRAKKLSEDASENTC